MIPPEEAAYHCRNATDKESFEKKFFNSYISQGVFATRSFEKGSFLLENAGEDISAEEGEISDAAIEDDLSKYEADSSADPPVVREVVQCLESSSSESSTKLKTQCTHSVRGAGLKRKRKKYIHWKADEEEEIRTQFRKYILGEAEKKLPSRKAIESYLLQESCNIKYDWWTVRTKIQNDKVKRERLVQLRALNMNM